MKEGTLPFSLQFFAEGTGAGTSGEGQQGTGQQNQQSSGQNGAQGFDYEKLASIVNGKQEVAEESVLKNYFKEQGLSKEDAEQAMAAYKQQRAASQPDVNAMQTQLTQAQAVAQRAQIENSATLAAVGLGLDAKSIPYVLKMANLETVMGQDGKINDEMLKNALNKVLEDVPALKPQTQQATGFIQVGATGTNQQQTTQSDQLSSIFGNKK